MSNRVLTSPDELVPPGQLVLRKESACRLGLTSTGASAGI